MKSYMKIPERHKFSLKAPKRKRALREYLRSIAIASTETGCWDSVVQPSQPTPTINVDGVPRGLHVVSACLFRRWALATAKTPVYRSCENTRCFNPAHLTRNHVRTYRSTASVRFKPEACENCKQRPQKWRSRVHLCVECTKEDAKKKHRKDAAMRRKNPEFRKRQNRIAKAYRERFPEKVKAANRKKYALYGPYGTLGLTRELVQPIYDGQEGACAICHQKGHLHLDHNHATGRVRAFLCGPCNRGIGMFKESAEALLEAAAYINKWKD